jgi:phage-related protein
MNERIERYRYISIFKPPCPLEHIQHTSTQADFDLSLIRVIQKNGLDNVHIFVYFINMKTISFYRTESGKCPVKEHLDRLTDTQATKIAWVLKLIREIEQVPSKYFKKLVKTNDIWEARVDVGKNTFRLLGFFHERELIILTNSFQKKSQKTPLEEIRLAEKRKNEYLSRR